ncbi:499_t:CDS:2 [Racocetra fulgida]|uniref:499_t:CDS:1 n=1 Tax=Racocetra fulgida TaxID=60492 RepID=A0A9N8VXD7_9GLOM|nr:499_t:CDS:2 [Racocetra fulgida]
MPDGQLKYDFMSAATRHLPYGRSGDREMTMVMKVECVVNIPYVDGFDFADGFNIVHVLVTDLIDENSAKREAKALSNAGTDFVTSKVVTQHYNWEGIHLATRILDIKNSGIIIDAFIAKIMKQDKLIWVNKYTGRRNKVKRKIYKKVKRQVYADIPSDINYNIFINYTKNNNFVGIYTEIFKKDRGGMIDSVMEFNKTSV